MPIQILDNFEVNVAKPIDNRFVVGSQSFYINKEQIPYRYPGLRIWDLNDSFPYVWTGVTWSNENQSGSVIGSGTPGLLPKFFGSNPTSNIINSQIFDDGTNVGINILTPTDRLHVVGNIRSTGNFIGNGSLLTSLNATEITSGSLSLDRITAGSSGQILVRGLSNAQFVNSSSITVGTSSVANNLVINTVSDTNTYNLLFSNASGLPSTKTIYTNSSSIRIQASTGNIGIGGNPQTYRLYVNGGASIGTTIAPPTNGLRVSGETILGNPVTMGYVNGSNFRIFNSISRKYEVFHANAFTTVTVENPLLYFSVNANGPSASGGEIFWGGSDVGIGGQIQFFLSGSTGVSGGHGINIRNQGSNSGNLRVEGEAYKTTSTWASISDRRLKDDIRDFKDGLSKVLELNPVYYKFKNLDFNSKEYIGFIAQDVEVVTPYMVKVINDSNGLEDCRVIDESALTKILVNAIKEQQSIIEDLTKRIEDLES